MILNKKPDIDPGTAQREFNKILQTISHDTSYPSPGAFTAMPVKHFKVGDHVSWNSEAGHVSGTISKVVTSEIEFKGYKVHASKDEPQYEIKSDKSDHIAMHKGSALRKVSR